MLIAISGELSKAVGVLGNHRMFTNTIVDSDKFLEMPLSTQALYFHLGMRADDEGFIGSPKKIIRAVNCTEDDLKLLIAKGFVICFESGIIVITHWNLHNTIRKDRKKDTFFQTEKALLSLNESNIYSIDNQMTTICQPSGNQMTAQGKLSKDKLSKDNISDNVSTSVDGRTAFDYQSVINSFNSICQSLPKVQKLTDTRRKKIKSTSRLLGKMTFEEVFYKVESSDFLSGRNGKWTACCFDWILNPPNLTKIIEGNYNNKQSQQQSTSQYKQGVDYF